MPIDGFLDQVDPARARGWAFDSQAPRRHITVEIICDERTLGFATANIYRADLDAANKGKGDHGFEFNFTPPLAIEELPKVMARVKTSAGDGMVLLRLRRAPPPPTRIISFQGKSTSPEQHPLFVLGAARSGTSALVQALSRNTRYQGYDEGQIVDLLALFGASLEKFYGQRSQFADAFTAFRDIPRKYFDDGIDSLFVGAMNQLFPKGYWVDKTPVPEMIELVPRLLDIWPNSRFIFLKRRPIENMVSRTRKFRNLNFAYHAGQWARCMQAWWAVKEHVRGRAIEIDHLFLARSPMIVAQSLGAFLKLDSGEIDNLADFLIRRHPERTAGVFAPIYDPQKLDWTEEEWKAFHEICVPVMQLFHYTMDDTYCTSDMTPKLL